MSIYYIDIIAKIILVIQKYTSYINKYINKQINKNYLEINK